MEHNEPQLKLEFNRPVAFRIVEKKGEGEEKTNEKRKDRHGSLESFKAIIT